MEIGTAFANPEIEKEGTWVDYRDGSKIKVARIGNPNFTRNHTAKLKPYRRKQRAGDLDDALETRLLCEVISETVLLDWEGFDNNGKPFKYTKSAAFDLLQKHIDFRNEVVEIASTEEVFHQELAEDSEKNS
tara:strand:- start:2754 stop:3149 length:396 start_codon:yes stop_codon:yes gene_type:complete